MTIEPNILIEVRCGAGTRADPHHWKIAMVTRTTPTCLFYRFYAPSNPAETERGPVRLDCEGRTWRRQAR